MAIKMKEEWEEMFGKETYKRLQNELGEKFSDFVKYITTPPEKRRMNEEFEMLPVVRGMDGKYYDSKEWAKMSARDLGRLIPRKTAQKKVEEVTFTEKEVEPIEVEMPKPAKKEMPGVETNIGTPFGDVTLVLNKKMPKEEIERVVNNRTLLAEYMENGTIGGARYRGKEFDMANENEREKIYNLLSRRPIGVNYPVKEIRER